MEKQQEPYAAVNEPGYVSFHLRDGIQVNVGPNDAIHIQNKRRKIGLTLSGCATQMAMVHPQGRVFQYSSRIEIQAKDALNSSSDKNAKMWPKGISFTSNNCALIYLVDSAGTRSTTDMFHDLYASDIAEGDGWKEFDFSIIPALTHPILPFSDMFLRSCQLFADYNPEVSMVGLCVDALQKVEYWKTDTSEDCWLHNGILIKQTDDGFVR